MLQALAQNKIAHVVLAQNKNTHAAACTGVGAPIDSVRMDGFLDPCLPNEG